MANPVDHEALQAAQALCMLAMDTRQQEVDGNETEDDDCVITQVRPAIHRHHPYRRSGMQQDAATIAITRRDAMALRRETDEWNRRARSILGGPEQWNVFPLEEHEMEPDAPVPEVRRVIRDGVVVAEKVPLPHTPPSGVQVQSPPPVRQLVTSEDTPFVRPTHIQRPSPLRQVQSAPPPTPVQQLTLQPTTDQQSSAQSPSHAPEDDTHPADEYSFRALALQALLAAPEDAWWFSGNVADWLEEKYPRFREQKANAKFRSNISSALTQNCHMLETRKRGRLNLYRLLATARETATIYAFKTKQPRGPNESGYKFQGEAFIKIPYTWKSLALQGLLAAPAGRWMAPRELVNYLATQYPNFFEFDRNILAHSIKTALSQTRDIVERSVQLTPGSPIYWRLAPGGLEEATRLAWPKNATHREPE